LVGAGFPAVGVTIGADDVGGGLVGGGLVGGGLTGGGLTGGGLTGLFAVGGVGDVAGPPWLLPESLGVGAGPRLGESAPGGGLSMFTGIGKLCSITA
jgi:hypothetical protein